MDARDNGQQHFLTAREIAHLLRYRTPRPVYNAIASGDLPAYEFGRDKRITLSDFNAWRETKRKRPTLVALAPAVSMRDLIDAA